MDLDRILREILRQYRLPWSGIHGMAHWGRVLENGLRLAEETGADRDVVTLFALFHDSCRLNEGEDPEHGARGAELAHSLRGSAFELPDPGFELLQEACVFHTAGLVEGDLTVRTCWDADRLDLGRVGIEPAPRRLATEAARQPELIRWAHERATRGHVPALVRRFQKRGN